MAAASTFGERLAYARWWRAGLIHREGDGEFAKRLGVTGAALSHWRERVDPVDVAKCEAIAKLCEVPLDWLQRGERTNGETPAYFARFLPVYRDWVKRGGLSRAPTKQAVKTSSKEIAEEEKRRRRRAG